MWSNVLSWGLQCFLYWEGIPCPVSIRLDLCWPVGYEQTWHIAFSQWKLPMPWCASGSPVCWETPSAERELCESQQLFIATAMFHKWETNVCLVSHWEWGLFLMTPKQTDVHPLHSGDPHCMPSSAATSPASKFSLCSHSFPSSNCLFRIVSKT